MGKNKPWSVTPKTLEGSTSERLTSSDTLSGTSKNSGSASYAFKFQHQYYLIVNSPRDSPSGSGWFNSGAIAYVQLSKSTVQGTSGTRYTFTGWSGDASGSNIKSNPLIMSSAKTATAILKTQYEVTFNVNPYNSGTTSPPGTQWYDRGQPVNIVATKKDSNAFSSWTKTSSNTITDASKATTTATINGPGTITANFAKPKDTTLTVNTVPKTVDKIGEQTTTITGRLTSNWQAVDGKLITLMYNSGNGDNKITVPTPIKTDSAGYYKFDWTPEATLPNGLYVIKATFAGDSNYKASSAATSCRGEVTVVPEYLFGGLAAMVSCFVGFAVFKKRSSLPHFKRL
jgi:hypothetical protein